MFLNELLTLINKAKVLNESGEWKTETFVPKNLIINISPAYKNELIKTMSFPYNKFKTLKVILTFSNLLIAMP